MDPDSGTVGLGVVKVLRLTFSEKMNRTSAAGWLHLYPPRQFRKTKWKGARVAEVTLFEPLPADTVIVVEVAGGMQDAHKVKNRTSRRFPVATADTIPGGRVSGVLVLADSAVTDGVVELFAAGPDSVEWFRRSLLRRAVTDRTGRFAFEWLPANGDPWLLRAYADRDGNLRPGDQEPQRLLPDTLSLALSGGVLEIGVATLYPVDAPGRLVAGPFAPPPWPGRILAFAAAVAEDDTGWYPGGRDALADTLQALDPDGGSVVAGVPPGRQRLIVFADVDDDSLFGALPAGRLAPLPDSLAIGDSIYYWEPWWTVEELLVEPGLATPFDWDSAAAPHFTSWTPPDTSTAAADTAVAGEEPR